MVFLRGHRPVLYPGGVVKCDFNNELMKIDLLKAFSRRFVDSGDY